MNPSNTPPPPPPLHSSSRRQLQLQGPRPSPLRVNKDSHRIKKPPLPPPQNPSPPSRAPLIIYTVSPKVFHVETANFMDLVQRLTGPSACIRSPAAKLTAIHMTIHSPGAVPSLSTNTIHSTAIGDILHEFEINRGGGRGILSPVPASLSQISPTFFSSSAGDSSFLDFLPDLSPAGFQIGRLSPGGAAGIFLDSPVNFLSPSVVSSPVVAAWNLFNHFQDF